MADGPLLATSRDLNEWARRYGDVGGDAAEVIRSIQPVVVVDDATALAPPLQAPEGWGNVVTALPVGNRAIIEFAAPPTGMFMIQLDVQSTDSRIFITPAQLTVLNPITWPLAASPGGDWPLASPLTNAMRTLVRHGEISSGTFPGDLNTQYEIEQNDSVLFPGNGIFVGPGQFFYIASSSQNTTIAVGWGVREVPARSGFSELAASGTPGG